MNAPTRIATPATSPVPLTVEAVRVLADAGVFEDLQARQELVDGVLVMAPPPGAGHWQAEAALVRLLIRAIDRAGLSDRLVAQTGAGLQIGADTLLGPDIMLRTADVGSHELGPADVSLVIEIVSTSLRRDRGDKAQRYAEAGVPEFWVIDVMGQTIIVHEHPADDGYRSVREVRSGETVSPSRWPQIAIAVAELF